MSLLELPTDDHELPASLQRVAVFCPGRNPKKFESDSYAASVWTDPWVPPTSFVDGTDLLVVVGPLEHFNFAVRLAGLLRLAAKSGIPIAFLYQGTLNENDSELLRAICPQIQTYVATDHLNPIAAEPAPAEVFHDYLILHGQSVLAFDPVPESADVLGHLLVREGNTRPTALVMPVEKSKLYVLPLYTGAGGTPATAAAIAATLEHLAASGGQLSSAASALKMPGEIELASEIAVAEGALEELLENRARLSRFKCLVGNASGDAFVAIVIDALNFVLSSETTRAVPIEEAFIEDFRLLEGAEDVAICEAKGVSGGIKLGHVNQVNTQRTELLEKGVADLPGILIVNTFRGDLGIERRSEDVSERVSRHAIQMNVTILRSWDLLGLVIRKMEDPQLEFQAHLLNGGWRNSGPTLG
ncbi:MAG: hypothetical protein ACRDKE_03595 [Solirubrobacterales bacterium]